MHSSVLPLSYSPLIVERVQSVKQQALPQLTCAAISFEILPSKQPIPGLTDAGIRAKQIGAVCVGPTSSGRDCALVYVCITTGVISISVHVGALLNKGREVRVYERLLHMKGTMVSRLYIQPMFHLASELTHDARLNLSDIRT